MLVSNIECSGVFCASLFYFALSEVTTVASRFEGGVRGGGAGSLLFKSLAVCVNASAMSSVLKTNKLSLKFKYRTSLSAVSCNVD